jgi:hypothetical protein
MLKLVYSRAGPDGPARSSGSITDLPRAMDEALADLAEINAAYQQGLATLQRWTGPTPAKERFARTLEWRYLSERRPHVRRLERLHHCMMVAATFGAFGPLRIGSGASVEREAVSSEPTR